MTETESLKRIYSFVEGLGIQIEERSLPADTFLPGLELGANAIIIDREQLKYPGDILHEAGHLAVTTSEQRFAIGTDRLEEPFPTEGEEIVTILWSYAAAVHIGIPLELVFHPHGYKGQAKWLMESFQSGTYIGLPLLEWMGMTLSPEKAEKENKPAFPEMIRWMRE